MKLRVLSATTLIVLAACEGTIAGNVTGKEKDPAYSVNQCVGNTGVCPPVFYPAVCRVEIDHDAWIEVPCEKYEEIKLGDFYSNQK